MAGDVTTVLDVDAGPAIGQVREFAGAVGEAASAWDAFEARLAGGIDPAGLAGLGDRIDGAADSISAAGDRIAASLKEITDAFAQAAAAGDSLPGLGAGLGAVNAALDESAGLAETAAGEVGAYRDVVAGAADAAGGLAEKQSALADSSAGAAGKMKSATAAAADMRDTQAALGETAAAASDAMKIQADQTAAMTALLRDQNTVMRESAAVMLQTPVVGAQTASTHQMAEAMSAQAAATDDVTASQVVQEVQARNLAKANEAASASAAESAGKWHMAALGGAALLGYGTYLAANLQAGATRLVTSAGESPGNIPMMEQGVLGMSGRDATSQQNLMTGAYWAESAGFHGKDAIAVLNSAAQGAYAEGADTGDTANALTTLLNDYYGGPQKNAGTQQDQATSAMNAIMASVGAGKMTLQGISGAMPFLLPAAKQAGLSLPQALGAESTMTAQGFSAEESAQLLKHTIGAVQKPTSVQAAEMQMLGIDPVQLAHDIGSQGLTGSIAEVDDAIRKHMGPGGMVMISTLNQSKLAAQSANEEIAAMPKGLQATAEAYLKGSISVKAWNAEMFSGNEPAREKNLLEQFAATANTAHGFSALVKSGLGDKQTVAAALSGIMGGQEGSQVAMAIGGSHLSTFRDDVDTIGKAAQQTGSNIRDWNQVQQELNYKLKDTEYSVEAFAAEAGQLALPLVTHALGAASDVLGAATSHPAVTKDVLEAGALLAIPAVLGKVESAGTTIAASAGKIGQVLGVPGADKLANLGQSPASTAGADAASGALTKVAGAAGEAAGALSQVASAGGKAAAGETEAGAAGTKEAAGESAAGAAGGREALGESAGGLGGVGAAGAGAGTAAEEAGGLGIGAAAKSTAIQAAVVLLGASMIDDRLDNKTDPKVLGNTDPKSWWNNWGTLGHGIATALDFGGSGGGDRAVSASPYGAAGGRGAALGGDYRAGAPYEPAAPPVRYPVSLPYAGLPGGRKPAVMDVPARVTVTGVDTAALNSVKSHIAQELAQAGGTDTSAPKAATQDYGWQTFAPKASTVPAVKIPPVDTSALDASKAHVASDLAGIDGAMKLSGAPVRVPAPDLSALGAAKAAAASDASGITAAMNAALIHPVRAAAPDLSALAAARGTAAADGAAVSAGFASGITAGAGAAVAAARAEASEAAAAMSTALDARSPSRVTYAIGEQEFDGGFKGGIAGGMASVVQQAAEVAMKTAAELDAVPKSTAKIGSDTIATLTSNLQGGQSAITAANDLVKGITAPFSDSTIAGTITTLKDDVAAALKKKTISAAQDSGLDAWITAEGNRLQSLAGQRATLESQIQQAQSYAQQTAAAANQGADIVTIAGNAQSQQQAAASGTPPAEPTYTTSGPAAYGTPGAAAAASEAASGATYSASDLITGMQQQVQQTRQFAADLKKLKAEGLNKAEMQQIASAGASAGDPVAEAILGGGKSAISQLNQLAKEMNSAAQSFGQTASSAVYDPSKLKAQLAGVNAQMRGVATQLVDTLDSALKGGASAAAFAGLGERIAQEIASGISSSAGVSAIESAITSAVKAAEAAGKKKGGDGSSAGSGSAGHSHAMAVPYGAGGDYGAAYRGGSGGGSGHTTAEIHVHVHLDGAVVATSVQQHTLERASQNLGGGMQMRGKQV